MTSLNLSRSRPPAARARAVLLPLLLVLAAPAAPAWGADGDVPANAGAPSAPTGGETPSPAPPPAETPAQPQLQLQDEGPSLERKGRSRMHLSTGEETEERPYWKSWVFWTVTGALALGAVAMFAYMQSGTSSGVAPCPVDVAVSLGCFGAGR